MKNKLSIVIVLATSLLLFSKNTKAQSACNNFDFENGNYINWSGYIGTNAAGMNAAPTSVTNTLDTSYLNATARHKLFTIATNGYDALCTDSATNVQDSLMTYVNPFTGNFSIRLGNNLTGSELEELSFSKSITATDTLITYFYACVQQQPNHPQNNQPFLKVKMRDGSGNIIATGTDSFYVGQPNVPFITSGSTSILYRRWSPVTVNLSAYVGQNVMVEFINADCDLGGHFAYSYIDGSCIGNPISNVWPGDCNYDMTCDYNDLLALGIAYGSTGTVRSSASNSWTAQPATDWSTAFPLGANYKHSDCNGDGVVDLNDTLAIQLNFGQNHPPRLTPVKSSASDPTLKIVPVNTHVAQGGIVDADIALGDATIPLSSIYGLKFKITADASLIDVNSITITYTGSWLGLRNTDLIALSKPTATPGEIMVGMVKNTHTNVNGSGNIAHIQFKVKSAIAGLPQPLLITISDVKAIEYNQAPISLNTANAQLTIDDASSTTGINNVVPAESITVYNHPGSYKITVTTNNFTAAKISLFNSLGQQIATVSSPAIATTFSTAALTPGIYYVEIKTESNKSLIRKVQVFN